MGRYDILLDGMTAASQTTSVPELIMRLFVSPKVTSDGLRATAAPLGLRTVEAVLADAGFDPEDVVVVAPEKLSRAVGAATRIVLVSSGDPLGVGMNDSTMIGVSGGKSYSQVWFARMMKRLKRLKVEYPQFRVIVGGAGAWQLEQKSGLLDELGIDLLFCGYAEEKLAGVVRNVISGGKFDRICRAPFAPASSCAGLLGASSMGVVEVSRGCGLGCPFCTINRCAMAHLPVARILADVRTNVEAGTSSVSLISEDFLRYGSEGMRLKPTRLLEMVESVRNVKGLKLIQLDHVNVLSAARFPDDALRELFLLLTKGQRHDYLWVNVGIETASGRLLHEAGCAGKMGSAGPANWEKLCMTAIDKLLKAGFTPMLSLVLGLPGETEDDIVRTIEFMRRLAGKRLVAFPLFLAPVSPSQKGFDRNDMTRRHWELFRLCYSFNFKWLPRIYWDNQAGAGVSLKRRLALQAGGRLRVLEWRLRLAARSLRTSL